MKTSKSSLLNDFSVVDLFCGIGGLSYGFVLEGFKIDAGIDLDKSCQFAFEKNKHEHTKNQLGSLAILPIEKTTAKNWMWISLEE